VQDRVRGPALWLASDKPGVLAAARGSGAQGS